MNLPALTLHDVLVSGGIDKVAEILIKMPQVECPVYHRFGPNLYIREVMMPAGTMAIGHHQKFEHLNVFIKGKVLMLNEDGTTTLMTAPMMFVGKPGRKVGYILEDMVWENIYSTQEQDVETLEATLFDKSALFVASELQRMAMMSIEREVDREDYLKMIEEVGATEELARSESEQESDRIDIELNCCQVSKSPIEGKGLFATANIRAGDVITTARIGDKRTQAGRFTNHAKFPNAEMVIANGNILLVALKDITGMKAGQLGEEITVDYRKCIEVAKNSIKELEGTL